MRHVRPVLGSVLLVAACNAREAPPDATAVAQAPHRLEVGAADFDFAMPDTVPAGLTTLVMRNDGPEFHHVQVVRLDDGKTLEEYLATVASDGPPPAWAVHVGGPQVVVPGDSSSATLLLTPGHYAAVCFVPSPAREGLPHVALGMSKEFMVVGEMPAHAAGPPPDLTMTLSDYDFVLSDSLTAGPKVIRVVNAAEQFHEAVIIQLAPGKGLADFMGWFAAGMQGPPPGRPIGGTAALDSGRANDITVTFEPGTYVFLCFLPDAGDGKEHVEHGMVKEITVS